MISFEFKPRKFASAVAYLAQQKPGLTKKQICKLLFFADKEHLVRFGRPITGDTYHALEQGPVPSKGLYAINGKRNPLFIEAVRKYGHLDGWTFRVTAPPDLKVFSKSEIGVLDRVVAEKGHLAAWQLENISHQEPAWQKAEPNGPMDFELFFEGLPDSDLVKEIVIEEQAAARNQ